MENSIPSSIFLVTRLSVFLKFSIYSLLENILDESSVTNPYWPLLLYKNNIYRIGPIYKSGAKRILYQSEERISLESFLLTSLSCLKDTHLHQSF